MKIEEFNSRRWHANTWVTYEGQKYYVISVNFPEGLLGLVPDKQDYPADEWSWVRCENIQLVEA